MLSNGAAILRGGKHSGKINPRLNFARPGSCVSLQLGPCPKANEVRIILHEFKCPSQNDLRHTILWINIADCICEMSFAAQHNQALDFVIKRSPRFGVMKNQRMSNT